MSRIKKVFHSLILMVAIFFGSLTFVACGEPKATKIRIIGVEQTVLINTEHNLNDLKLIVSYNKGESKTVAKNNDMKITAIDTTKEGKQNLVVEYIGLTAKLEIEVVGTDGELYGVYGFQKPDWQVKWESYRDGLEDGDGEYNATAGANFMVNNHADNTRKDAFASVKDDLLTYKVGDDNEFKYLANAKTAVFNENGVPTGTRPLVNYEGTVKVEKKNGSNWTELTGDALNAMVTINSVTSLDFTQQAVGGVFRITVTAQNTKASVDPISIEVEVVDGWNAYKIWDLSIIDNSWDELHDSDKGVYAWEEIKTRYGLLTPEAKGATGVVLHSDFTITLQDIPAGLLWGDGAKDASQNDISNTLKDAKTLYQRNNVIGETFSVYGNFHTIDASNVPYCKYLTHDETQAHSYLLGFGGDNNNGKNKQNQGNAYVENLSMKGNIGKTNVSDDGKYGLQGIICSSRHLEVVNCISQMFQVQAGTMYSNCDNVIDRQPTSFEYSFSQLLNTYGLVFGSWGSGNATLNHCVIKDAGGPIVAGTHVTAENPETGKDDWLDIQWPEVTMIDCEVSSLTAQTAPWYAQFSNQLSMFTVLGNSLGELVPEGGNNFVKTVDGSQVFSVLGVTTINDGKYYTLPDQITKDEEHEDADDYTNTDSDHGKGRGIVNIVENGNTTTYDLQSANIRKLDPFTAMEMPIFICNGVYLSYNGSNLVYLGSEVDGDLQITPVALESELAFASVYTDLIKFFYGDTCQIIMTNFGGLGVLNIVAQMFPVA